VHPIEVTMETILVVDDKRVDAAFHEHVIILFVRQSDARILEANQAASEAYGYSAAELMQLTEYDLHTPDEFENLTKYLAHTSDGQNIAFETTHRRKDGSSFPVEIAAKSTVINEELVILNVIRDVSGQHQADHGV
jgi:PAS domain S-box-containing protein